MPPGRPPLDPDLKKQHLRESRRRYEEKNAVQRRSAAHLRMQRHRNSIASSDIITRRKHARKVAVHSENYRDRKNEKDCANQRAADAARKDIRDHELQALRQRHTPTPKPPPCTHSRKFTLSVPPPIAQPAAVTKAAQSATAVPSLLHG